MENDENTVIENNSTPVSDLEHEVVIEELDDISENNITPSLSIEEQLNIVPVSEPKTNAVELLNENGFQTFDKIVVSNKKHKSYKSRIIKLILFLIFSIVLTAFFSLNYFLSMKNTSSYTENAGVTYQGCLKENDYYDDKCIGEDVEYIASITDVI